MKNSSTEELLLTLTLTKGAAERAAFLDQTNRTDGVHLIEQEKLIGAGPFCRQNGFQSPVICTPDQLPSI